MRNTYYLSDRNTFYNSDFDGARKGFTHNCLSFGDYDNSCHVERSNVRVFLDMFEEQNGIYYELIYSAYSGETLFFFSDDQEIKPLSDDDKEIVSEMNDVLNALEDYPCIDDEDCSMMKLELIEEAKDSFISDFQRTWENQYGFDRIDIYDIDDDVIWTTIWKRAERHNQYFEIEAGGTPYIDIEKLI